MGQPVDIYDIPEGKNVEDYPEGTVFVLNEDAGPRYDKTALIERGDVVKISPGEPNYDTALPRTEFYELVEKIIKDKKM